MQGSQISITPTALFARLGTAAAPVVVDVRRTAALAESDRLIVSAFHRPPEDVARWAYELPVGRPVVVYCVHGHEVGQNAAKALRAAGITLEDATPGVLPNSVRTSVSADQAFGMSVQLISFSR